MMTIDVAYAAEFLRENDNYLILMHASPDGDTLGCGWALCRTLRRMGKRLTRFAPTPFLINSIICSEDCRCRSLKRKI